MILEYKKLSEVTIDDLQSLVDSQYSEQRNIDYKLKLPDDWNAKDAKRKFLSDVCAFANSDGGFLLYGIKEENTIPTDLVGIPIAEIEAKHLQVMTGIINNGVQPRLFGYDFQQVPINENYCILIVKVEKSLNAPHMVSFSGLDRFYHRNAIGNEQMDVYQIRQAFLASDQIFEKVKKWRNERILEIESNNTFSLANTGKLVLHIVPLQFEETLLSNSDLAKINEYGNFPTLNDSLTDARFNADGVLHYYQRNNQPDLYVHYNQLFRNGNFEAVDTSHLREGSFGYISLEVSIAKCVIKAMKMYPKLRIASPIIVMLSLIDVRGTTMSLNDFRIEPKVIDRSKILFDPLIILPSENNILKALKPLFDMIANSCGLKESLSYGANGEWLHIGYLRSAGLT